MTPEIRRYRLRHRTRPLDVLVAGEGESLALLHGWGLSGRAYRPAIAALAALGYRVAAPSVAVSEGWSIETASEITAEAMAGVDVAPAIVVGHSFGGAIGTNLTLHHTDFVRALIAVDSPLVALGNLRLGRIMLPGPHYRIATHGPAAAALIRSVAVRGGIASLARSARWFLSNEQDRVLAEIARLGIPRAIVWASNDTLLPVDIGVRAAELLECGMHVVDESDGWPGARPPDHDWPFREPAHFAGTIDRIVRQLMGARKEQR